MYFGCLFRGFLVNIFIRLSADSYLLTGKGIIRTATVAGILMLIIMLYFLHQFILLRKKKQLQNLLIQRANELHEANIILTDNQSELIQKNNEIMMQNTKLSQLSDKILMQNAELEKHRLNLQKLVDERTNELIIAKTKAEESDKLKSAFLANMSHEIRTPINAIVGFADLLKDKNYSPEEKHDFADIISLNSEVLLVLINDILDLSIIEADQLRIRKETTEINLILDHIYSSFSRINKKKDLVIRLNNELQSLNLRINTDTTRMKQILANLMNNSYKFTESGTIELGARKNQNHIILYVKDTGIGICEDELPMIFNRFRKSETRNNILYRGTGLGLAISKALSERLGYTLSVESSLGKGSAFYLNIPDFLLLRDEISGDQVPIKTETPKWSDKKILIVEDEKANFIYLKKILDKTNAKIHWAQNGFEALKLISKGTPYHVVVMDIKMPEMDGFEATKIIKSNNPQQVVIALTAYARPEDRVIFAQADFNDYYIKPIKPEVFMDMIRNYLH
jgi:signal transduction histidine kinase